MFYQGLHPASSISNLKWVPQIRRHHCDDMWDSHSICNTTCLKRDYVPPEYFISSSCQEIDSKQSTMENSNMKGLNLGTYWHNEITIKQNSNSTKSKLHFCYDGFYVFGNFLACASCFSWGIRIAMELCLLTVEKMSYCVSSYVNTPLGKI